MISVLNAQTNTFRTFGWVQDPSNFRSLCDVVAIFNPNTAKYAELFNYLIPHLVEKQDGRDTLLNALKTIPLRIKYSHLVGSAFTPRSSSRCNGIIQAAVRGQSRDFIVDWPADNFLRWAHCLGFVRYDYTTDTFEITPSGIKLTEAKTSGEELNETEIEILTTALLAYPPATRILTLLYENEGTLLTKFELGRQLGFVGEDGFTSMPQKTLIYTIAQASPTERAKMRSDWEGSSDKYARMIARWLEKLKLVEKRPKQVTIEFAGSQFTETIGQSYLITAKGITELRRSRGMSKHSKIKKNICWEMLATKGSDREYLRTRRAFILKLLSDKHNWVSLLELEIYLKEQSIETDADTLLDDIKGLQNIGINISQKQNNFYLEDRLNDFAILIPTSLSKSTFTETKEKVRSKLKVLSHEYLALIDLAYDSSQNRLFEMKTLDLLLEECDYQGMHLGGSRKPDGIIYRNEPLCKYGVIIDTKAYSKGYNLPISQADEMERYIGENQTRDSKINPNEWWKNFDHEITDFYFMFISGHFVGNYQSQIERISRNKNIKGTAMSIANLLLFAEAYKSNFYTHSQIKDTMFTNSEFIIS